MEENRVLELQRETPVYDTVDVLVLGAGPAGWGAAISAAREGAKTLLVEGSSDIGGVATTGLMSHWTGTVSYTHLDVYKRQAYIMWDPVHMYNAVVNDWKDVEHQITFDVRQPKTHAYTMKRLRKFIEDHPYVNVLRFTTFFHQFTLMFDELAREKYVEWYGYSASVSPYILEQFEKEVGYPFRAEYIIDQGYYNNQYRIPSKEFKDFQAFQRREVAKIAKEMVRCV